ncbi:Uncharacterised protein [Zhongshania aliphaticivorans]|uniref:DUF2157 domain-containing protein n=1 Tax=Zhongshania aliphaticivorans TaxID=1470434 RepID=A0A5S9PX93_9GAMM|nr:DUF2157 domain-containing protein [Zhongshania aliphaticivorans]CAA0092389.1 Uncharacterised protein [Zhongshania aliphaticivorans]CAA0109658.1 Uncharacterised protein [Zhongshania aliphaticivorans]
MDNNNPWLRAEIAQWLREGIINDQQAQALYARYPAFVAYRPKSDGAWGKVIFAVLGAVIFGLGIILLFAYNWQDMHRYLKLAVISVGILGAHGSALLMGRSEKANPRVVESIHILGTMLFGAGIWLVAQIYHMDLHFPDGFLLLCLAALSLAWALPSVAHGVLAILALLLWSGVETFEFGRHLPLASGILLFVLLPLAYLQRSSSFLACLLLALPVSYSFTVLGVDDSYLFVAALLLLSSYFGVARLAMTSAYPASAMVLTSCGSVVWLPLIYIGTFTGLPALPSLSEMTGIDSLYLLLPLILTLGVWTVVLARPASRPSLPEQWLESGLVLFVLVFALLPALFGADMSGLSRVVFNIALLNYALLYVFRGTQYLKGWVLTLGCVMLVLLGGARFTDLFHSLLARSAVFLLLGLLLFVIGLRYSKQLTRRKLEKPRA